MVIKSKKELIKVFLLFAIMATAGFFMWQAFAGIFKTNTPQSNRWTDGLVGHWTFDGQDTNWNTNTTNDLSGNSNHGIITNMSTSTSPAPGKVGSALDFDGVDDYVSCGSGASLDDITVKTVEVWIYLNGWGEGGAGRIIQKSNINADGWGLMVQDIDGGSVTRQRILFAQDFSTATGWWGTSDYSIALNNWYHVVIVYDRSSIDNDPIIYLNGVSQTVTEVTTPSGSVNTDASNSLWIGARNNSGTDREFNGLIDEVRIYNRALSADEILEQYKAGAERLAKTSTQQSGRWTDGLIGHWTFDGQNIDWGTNTVSDLSGNNNNGTTTNMSTSTSPAPGRVGQALDFDGTDDYVGVPNFFNPSSSDFSLTAWVYAESEDTTNHENAIYTQEDGTGTGRVWIERLASTYSSAPKKLRTGLGGPTFIDGATDLELNQWYFVSLTVQGTSVKLYLNGVQDGSGTKTVESATGDFRIGSHKLALSGRKWDGIIDEVRIYNRALSADEILEQYKAGAERLAKTNTQQSGRWTDGLVGHWTLDGQDINWGTNTFNDVSGNGNNATSTNMSTSTSPAPGKVGQALDFDGADDSVSASDSATLDIASAITVAVWVKPRTISSTTQQDRIISKYVDYELTISTGDTCDWGSGDIQWRATIGGSNQRICGGTINLGEWHFIVGTYDGSNFALYLNGSSINSVSRSGAITTNNYDFVIGNSPAGPRYFDGLIDEVRIYNRALSADEIGEIYRAGAGR